MVQFKKILFLSAFFFAATATAQENTVKTQLNSRSIPLGIKLDYSNNPDSLLLNALDIFKTTSYDTNLALLKNLTSQIGVSVANNNLNVQFEKRKRLEISAGLGVTYSILDDVDFYVWPSFLLSQGKNLRSLFNPQIGFIIRQIYNMKMLLKYERQFAQNKQVLDIFNATQSFNYKNYSGGIQYIRHQNNKSTLEKTGLFVSLLY